MTRIDRDSPVPLYEQIKQILREQILDGKLPPGSRLPTEHELCAQYDVSRITVKRALDDLASAGLVRRIQGRGSTVEAVRKVDSYLDAPVGFSETVRRQGLRPGSEIVSVDSLPPDIALRQAFGILADSSARFMNFRRRFLIEERPVALLNIVVTEELGRKLLEHDLTNASFFRLYSEIYKRKVARSEVDLSPITASREMADHLEVQAGTAHFHFRSLSYLEGDFPVELSRGVFSGDVFTWRVTMYQIREEQLQHLSADHS